MAYRTATMSRPSSALAATLSFLGDIEPFASMPLKRVVKTVTGAIARGHHGFIVDGAGAIVGVGCYALASEETVARMLAGEEGIDSSAGEDGEVVVLLMTAARDRRATVMMLREMACRHPGQAWVQQRHGRPLPGHGRFPPKPGTTGAR